LSSFSSMAVIVSMALLLLLVKSSSAQLSTNLYPLLALSYFSTVKSGVQSAISAEKRMGASLLRLFFHDCFVDGCDGSILLDNTSNFTGEKDALPNKNSVRGFDVIDKIKKQVEKACPGVLGRRDSTTASESAANNNIPPPSSSLSNLISKFSAQGLSPKRHDCLSGAHTLGKARCISFRAHIYNDSDIDNSFAKTRRANCPSKSGSGDNNLAPLDFETDTEFDNYYYKNLIIKKGLLHSDQELFNGGSADSQVKSSC
ncbi:peroxidase 4-like, partial [Dioscorea cayenensis subsp. rotundata]|uniref:Peroxidase 4-like n=1 Tax=Dioscorea cayennensis subsp. rotundata TaxID=55577 RepID=A0AB40C0Z4_DIOCR